MNRAAFLRLMLGGLAGAVLAPPLRALAASGDYDFWFTRLKYDSGDWDVDQRMPANVITSLIDYTNLRVDPEGARAGAGRSEDARARRSATWPGTSWSSSIRPSAATSSATCATAASSSSTTATTTSTACSPSRSRRRWRRSSAPTRCASCRTTHPLYRSFFGFDGPPATGFELNGWGDDLVHDYLQGIEIDGRLGVLYSNKDYGCEWDYDWRNKRFLAEDNTKFAVNIVMYALTA